MMEEDVSNDLGYNQLVTAELEAKNNLSAQF